MLVACSHTERERGGREGEREGGREGGREGAREGGREGGRERGGGREGGVTYHSTSIVTHSQTPHLSKMTLGQRAKEKVPTSTTVVCRFYTMYMTLYMYLKSHDVVKRVTVPTFDQAVFTTGEQQMGPWDKLN